jgi:hypothetical protein
MLQTILVALIVLAAAAFSVWKLMPARWRLRAWVALDRRAAARPALAGLRSRVIAPRLAKAGGSGCGGCAANTHPRPR